MTSASSRIFDVLYDQRQGQGVSWPHLTGEFLKQCQNMYG